MQSHKLVVWDDSVYSAMVSFPQHRFDTPAVAVVPMRSATREHFVVVVEADGRLSCISPTIHTVHSVTPLLDDDAQEEAILSGIAVHDAELCVVLWHATLQSYTVYFLKAQRTALSQIGIATLSAPDPSLFLCGVTHLGNAVCVVWSDGVLQYYTPSAEAQTGLALTQTYRLSGFDFWAMKKGAGTEDLRKLPGSISVCSSLNVPGLVCVVGPQAGSYRLKYVVLNVEAGLVQESGILNSPEIVKSPIKVVPDRDRSGEFRLFVGEEDCGVKTIRMTPTTLATRIGINTPNRKRKLNQEAAICQKEAPHEQDRTLHAPHWAHLLTAADSKGDRTGPLSRKILKRLSPAGSVRNGEIVTADSFDERVSQCLKRLQQMQNSQQQRHVVEEALEILKEWKSGDKILLVDLAGIIAEAIGADGADWQSLKELLTLCPPKSLTCCPELPLKLLRAGEFVLFLKLLAGVQEIRSDELNTLLQAVLVRDQDPDVVASQMNAIDRAQSRIHASLDVLEHTSDVPAAQYERLKWTVYAFSGFSFDELLLHGVVSLPISRVDLEPVLQHLTRHQLKFLISYLHKWIRILKTENTEPERIDQIELLQRVPSMQNVVDWMSILSVLHAHSIINDPSLHSILKEMQLEMKFLKADFKLFLSTSSLCKELMRPKRQKKQQSSEYQIEVLDLTLPLL